MIRFLASSHFDSAWYWLLHVVVWAVVCARTLGVPSDMLLRARRDSDAAARVDLLAGITAERLAGLADRVGPVLAGGAGFVVAALAGLGFWTGIEAAQAVFFLAAPLAAIGYSSVRLALWVRRRGLVGPRLVLALGWRRTCHQAIAVVAVLAAIATAVLMHGQAV